MALFSFRRKQKTPKSEDGEMSFLEHLESLRWHIMRSVVAILLFAVVLFSFRQEIIGGIFMSPFNKNFVTYRILCEEFGQLCNTDIAVTGVETSAPDSLTLEGYMWVAQPAGVEAGAPNSIDEPSPLSPPLEPVIQDSIPSDSGQVLPLDTNAVPADTGEVQLDSMPSPPPAKPKENWVRQKMKMKVSVEQFLDNGQIKGFSVQTDKGDFVKFQATSPYEQFMKALFYAFFGGLIFAFPYVIWEVWRFISPALNKKERRLVRWNVFYSSLLFFFGILFGYFIILPFSITFLSSFVLFDQADNIWRIGDVVNFVLILLFGSGFLFQLPVAIYYLSKIGFVSPRWLRKYRKHAVVALLGIAAIITPPDPASQILIFFPLIGLYEIGIMISARVERKREERNKAEREADETARKERVEKLKQKAAEEKKKAEAKKAASAEQEAESDKTEAEQQGQDASLVDQSVPENEIGNASSEEETEDLEEEPEEEDEDDDDDDFDFRPPEGVIQRDD